MLRQYWLTKHFWRRYDKITNMFPGDLRRHIRAVDQGGGAGREEKRDREAKGGGKDGRRQR